MLPNQRYKTTLCRYWESSELSRRALPAGPEVPLRARSAGAAQAGRRDLTSRSCTTSCCLPSPSLTPSTCTRTTARCAASTSISVGSPGSCKNGDKCTFAHGDDQLRAPQQNPGYQAHAQHAQSNPLVQPPSFAPYGQMAPPAEPAGGQLTENNIIILQLHFIVQKLWEIYPADTNIHYYLRNAVDLLNMGNIDMSADTLHVG